LSNQPASITIGMPLYNNERTLRRAVESVLAQTRQDFMVVASDDGSRDNTVTIMREYARADSRIKIFEQPKNLNYGNLRFVLNQAKTPYFVFLAGDDWWEPAFLDSCIQMLEERPAVVCVVSLVQMHPDSQEAYVSGGTRSLLGSREDRIVEYLHGPGDNSRTYGVFRSEAAKSSFPDKNFYAFDWAFCARSLVFGQHVELSEVLMHREVTVGAQYFAYARRDGASWITRIFPLLSMSRDLLRAPGFPKTLRVLFRLMLLNRYMHAGYVAEHYPRFHRVYRHVLRDS